MKKIFILLFVSLILAGINKIQAQTISGSVTPVVCFNTNNPASNTVTAFLTSTCSGAASYTWWATGYSCTPTYSIVSTGTAVNVSFPCTGIFTIAVQAYSTNSIIGTCYTQMVVHVIPSNWLNIQSSTGLNSCNGSSVSLAAPLGSGYSWTDGNNVISTASSIAVSPTVNTCYTVTANHISGGCPGSAVACVSLSTLPTLTVTAVSGTANCQYNGVSLQASGATSYSWFPTWLGNGSTASTWFGSSPCYTVLGSTGGCVASAVICPTFQPTPPLTLAASPATMVCSGTSVTLTATGSQSYSWTSWTSLGNIISTSSAAVVTPSVSSWGQYTVTAINANGCHSYGYITLSVTPGPQLNAIGSNSFCAGQSKTLTLNMAGSYTWTGPQGALGTSTSVVVTPTATTCYSVSGTSTNGCAINQQVCLVLSTPPVVSVGGNTIACSNGGTYLTASGANNYIWSAGNYTTVNATYFPQVNTCYTVTGYNSTGCTGTAAICVTVIPAPSYTGNVSYMNVCSGNSATLATMPSQFNYHIVQWTPYAGYVGTGTANAVVFTPTASAVYSVALTNTIQPYCHTTFTTYVQLSSPPVISISGNNTVCQGNSINLSAFGANNYTWSTGSTGQNITVNPSSNVCYSVIATTTAGCVGTAVKCVTVNPLPIVNISGNVSSCIGTTVSLSASGANSYFWNINTTAQTINVTPNSNTCYSVVGTANGCSSSAVHCVTVLPLPVLSISPSSQTVCLGSSAILTVSGANSYVWSTSATTSTINVQPTVTTNYMVTGAGANGCIGTSSAVVTINPNCSDVWPGDANSDGVVGTTDVLEIGLAFLNTGPPRTAASNNYIAQYANNWSGTVSSGKNQAHADCNGDGTINLSDTLAIFNNFSMTHSFRGGAASQMSDVNLVSEDGYQVIPGEWNKLNIEYGSDEDLVAAYGLVFDLNFDQSLIDNNEAYIVYTLSFMNANTNNVEFRKSQISNGKIYAATVRTDGVNAAGGGKIGEFHFKLKSGLPSTTSFVASIANSSKVDYNRATANLTGNTVALSMNPVSIRENMMMNNISLYPNPATTAVTLRSTTPETIAYTISDIVGRKIMTGNFIEHKTLNTETLANGAYIITFESTYGFATKKLVIQK